MDKVGEGGRCVTNMSYQFFLDNRVQLLCVDHHGAASVEQVCIKVSDVAPKMGNNESSGSGRDPCHRADNTNKTFYFISLPCSFM